MLAFSNKVLIFLLEELRNILNDINYLCWAKSFQDSFQGIVEPLRVGPVQIESHFWTELIENIIPITVYTYRNFTLQDNLGSKDILTWITSLYNKFKIHPKEPANISSKSKKVSFKPFTGVYWSYILYIYIYRVTHKNCSQLSIFFSFFLGFGVYHRFLLFSHIR